MNDRSPEEILGDAVRARMSGLSDAIAEETAKQKPQWARVADAAEELAAIARALDSSDITAPGPTPTRPDSGA